MMAQSLSQAASLLARELSIPAESWSQFAARVRYLVRLGLVPEMNMSGGKAAPVSAQQMSRLCLAIQMNLFGVGPETVVAMMGRMDVPTTNPVTVKVWTALGEGEGHLIFWMPRDLLAQADTRREAETGTGSGRSPSGTVQSEARDAPNTSAREARERDAA
jgi:hypothetical protein